MYSHMLIHVKNNILFVHCNYLLYNEYCNSVVHCRSTMGTLHHNRVTINLMDESTHGHLTVNNFLSKLSAKADYN